MTRKQFREMIESRVVVLDGATGTNLQKAGMPTRCIKVSIQQETKSSILSKVCKLSD